MLRVYLPVVRLTVLGNDMLQAIPLRCNDRPGCGTGKGVTGHPVYVHVNSNVKLVTVVLYYAYLYPMMCHIYVW